MNVCFRKTRYLLQQPEIAGPPYQVRLLHCKCDIEDMENGMEFHLQIKTMRFINQYGVRFKYRARLDTLRAKSGSEINIRLCCFHTFRMSVHLSIYRLKQRFGSVSGSTRSHCIWPDPDPLQSPLRIQIRIHFDFFPRIRIHLSKH